MNKIGLLIQFALNPRGAVQSETSTYVQSTLKFKDAIREILAERQWFSAPEEFTPDQVEVYVNRSPTNPFSPIAASEEQYAAYERSLVQPPHAPLLGADLDLTVAEVVAKHKIVAFTLYLKPPS
jgi:hypothetical protein